MADMLCGPRFVALAYLPAVVLGVLASCAGEGGEHDRGAGGGRSGAGGTAGAGGIGGWGGGGGCGYTLPCPACGDGQRDPGEECDDDNTMFGDGCNGLCQVEANWDCSDGFCVPAVECGDRTVGQGEACDDGNTVSGDGCAGDCKSVECDWYCPVPGTPCRPSGRLLRSLGGEIPCSIEPCIPSCGNGLLEDGEDCDDGFDKSAPAYNDDNRHGGCSTMCKLGPRCGDGMVNGDEECDMGKDNGVDLGEGTCSLACTRLHFCGDGIPDGDLGEECDLGDLNGQPDQGCDRTCKDITVRPKICWVPCL
jgi:cysteine-rich repeat protein